MGFLEDIWDGTKNVFKGIGQICSAIAEVLVDSVLFVLDVVFSVTERLFSWIDNALDCLVEKGKSIFGVNRVIEIPPAECVSIITKMQNEGHITIGKSEYNIRRKATIASLVDNDNKVLHAQVIYADKGFDEEQQQAFDKNHLFVTTIRQ